MSAGYMLTHVAICWILVPCEVFIIWFVHCFLNKSSIICILPHSTFANFFFVCIWKLFFLAFCFSLLCSCTLLFFLIVHYFLQLSICSNALVKVREGSRVAPMFSRCKCMWCWSMSYQQFCDVLIKTLLNSATSGQKLHRAPLMLMLLALKNRKLQLMLSSRART